MILLWWCLSSLYLNFSLMGKTLLEPPTTTTTYLIPSLKQFHRGIFDKSSNIGSAKYHAHQICCHTFGITVSEMFPRGAIVPCPHGSVTLRASKMRTSQYERSFLSFVPVHKAFVGSSSLKKLKYIKCNFSVFRWS